MLCLGWMFLWFVAGEQTAAFNHSACATKILWMYSVGDPKGFVLFCDLQELQKQNFSHITRLSPTQGPAHTPCSGSQNLSDVQWYKQRQSGEPLEEISRSSLHTENNGMLHIVAPQENDVPAYICKPRIRSPQDVACCVKTVLKVKLQSNESCGNTAQDEQILLLGSTGSIHCPSLSCQEDVQSPEMTWYQDGRLLENKENPLEVDDFYDFDQGLYVCDYTQSDNVSSWTVRAVVQVRAIGKDMNWKPDILDPITDTLEVELGKLPSITMPGWPCPSADRFKCDIIKGKSLTLPCKVQFGFQKDLKAVIKWYAKDSTGEWELPVLGNKSIKHTFKEKVIEHTAFLREVTQRDLSRTFVCFAQNSIGNTTRILQLRQKDRAVFVYILPGMAMLLVGVLVAAALLYCYWIEVVLLCRTYSNKDETLGDKKEFDAFVSYANWSSPESEATGSLSEEHLALNLFPEVLENKYGYTLCLLERDVTPGGVYADDVVNIIKKSRRGIFILSPSYVNGSRVFELQAAVNLALVDQTLKLILIKFCSFQEPESLPYLVKKALRVLPTVTWKGLKSVQPGSRFWTQICYRMPVKSSNRFMFRGLRIIPRGFPPDKDLVRQKPLRGVPSSGDSHGARNPLLSSH